MVPLEEIVNIGKKKNIPIILDAADELPPRSNLENFIQMGVDLVIFSGGKGIEGPNNTGFILGRQDLIQACAMHSNPNRKGIGRGYKVSKEDIVGLVTALQRFMEEDSETKVQQWIARAKRIGDALKPCPGVETLVVYPTETGKQIPYVRLTLNDQNRDIKAAEIVHQLKKGNPPIMVFAPYANIGILNIEVQTLRDGEEEILIRQLTETLKKR
jgi:seryl-tRNA(Sec) selenium transferase